MKPNQNKGKLQLKKQAISNLTNTELNNVKGGLGKAELTTSYGSCTGGHCCGATHTCTIWVVSTVIITRF